MNERKLYAFRFRLGFCRVLAFLVLIMAPGQALTAAGASLRVQADTKPSPVAVPTMPGKPFTADALTRLLPPSVYFQGRTAMLQSRNAGGTTFAGGAVVWAALVDTSGYASDVQERYQFYLVTEGPLQVGSASLPAGVYGAGFVGERFLIMDVGGHSLAEGTTQLDSTLQRPRPLQILPESPASVRLYLGRRWVTLKSKAASR